MCVGWRRAGVSVGRNNVYKLGTCISRRMCIWTLAVWSIDNQNKDLVPKFLTANLMNFELKKCVHFFIILGQNFVAELPPLTYFSLSFLFVFIHWRVLQRLKLSVGDVIVSQKGSNGD